MPSKSNDVAGQTQGPAEPIHPGKHLAEIMQELDITQSRLAKTIGVPAIRIHEIVHGRRSITADSALRIGKALGMTPEFWLNLQRMYDLDVARTKTDTSAIKPLVEVSL
ncbi:MAG: HigA family addiction module antitoxin [Caldilineaceae bacterium]|nr:HigA family addiction module antitoxin [Caldilineaceae bacterium]